ncbi:hypothetical protein PLICRDRAFT_175485 [Plicaturopsis crispa FD-325 SS-3]|nr:hypothetical protein PLICRDRAFT_175485 [Plicaturopsis crispa FD-325 SS-3]
MPPKSPLWKYFHSIRGVKFGENNTHMKAWCKGCLTRYIDDREEADAVAVASGVLGTARQRSDLHEEALANITCICGKISNMERHLRTCGNLQPGTWAIAQRELEEAKENTRRETAMAAHPAPIHPAVAFSPSTPNSSLHRAHAGSASSSSFEHLALTASTPDSPSPLKKAKSGSFNSTPTKWSPNHQTEFDQDLCNVFVACGIPWNAAANPQLKLFTQKWIPGAKVPDRRALSGKVLDGEVAKVEEKTRVKIQGKLATGQCDGWKNIAKTSVVTSMVTVKHEAYLVRTHDVSNAPKTGDHLLELTVADIQYVRDKFGLTVIGWCTDDGPDGKRMRRLLKDLMAWMIVTVCWSHQINLIVGNYLTLDETFLKVVTLALDVVKWFNGHSRALGWFNAEQKLTAEQKRILALLLPVITRWTAHYLCVSRLLRLSTPMKTCCLRHYDALLLCAGTKPHLKAEAKRIVDTVGESSFWVNLAKVKTHLEPLAIAANITQSAHTRLDHILLVLANLTRIYSNPAIDQAVRERICNSLETRWRSADQDVFILAVFFNPYIRSRCFAPSITQAKIWACVERVYKRIYNQDVSVELFEAFGEYYRRCGMFSDEDMALGNMKAMFDKKDMDIDLVLIWERLEDDADVDPATPRNGPQGLIKLAIRLLSVIGNSAGCERAFSDFGVIHTKRQNRMAAEKTHKIAVVKMELRRAHVAAGLTRPRRKRAFGEREDQPTPSTTPDEATSSNTEVDDTSDFEGDSDPANFQTLADDLIRDSINARDEQELDPPAMPRPSRGTKTPLIDLFRFPRNPAGEIDGTDAASDAGGLAFYWRGGVVNLDKELAAYDLLHDLNTTEGAVGNSDESVAAAPEQSSGPDSTMPSA